MLRQKITSEPHSGVTCRIRSDLLVAFEAALLLLVLDVFGANALPITVLFCMGQGLEKLIWPLICTQQ